MTPIQNDVSVFINHHRFTFHSREQTGASLKQHADIPPSHVLCVDPRVEHTHEACECQQEHTDELKVVADGEPVLLENGQHFWSVAPASQAVVVTINRKPFEFADPHQTGRSLKERTGIALSDVLFRDRPHEDEVITDDTKVVLACGDCFHSEPPANYGATSIGAADVGFQRFETFAQADGWTFLVVPNYPVPDGFGSKTADLLVKLPPAFPDAAPDMFWLKPPTKTATGGAPHGTSEEMLLGTIWQRFSWHLQAGAWRPGISTLRDFMRCVRARLEKRN